MLQVLWLHEKVPIHCMSEAPITLWPTQSEDEKKNEN